MQLTSQQISLFKKYGGDEDGFSRIASTEEKHMMRGVSWSRISDLIQSLSLVKRKIASPTLRDEILREVRGECSDESVVSALLELAD